MRLTDLIHLAVWMELHGMQSVVLACLQPGHWWDYRDGEMLVERVDRRYSRTFLNEVKENRI